MSPEQSADLHRQLGEMTATNRAVLDRLDKLEAREAARDLKIGAVHDWMQQARGSWKALAAAGGFGAALTGALIKVLSVLGILK